MNKHNANQPPFEQWLAEVAERPMHDDVPHWDRQAAMRHYNQTQSSGWASWWVRPVALTSFVLSCVAVSMLVVQQYQSHLDERMEQRIAERVDAIMDQRLELFEEQQKMRLAQQEKDLRSNFREQLSASTAQLATYILATNRKERGDDLQQLVEYVNDTREEDVTFFAQQLQRVERQVNTPILENDK